MDELVAEEYLDHHPPPFPGLPHGREGVKQAFQISWEATPGYHRIDDQIAEGDKVVTRLTAIGKHEGDLPVRRALAMTCRRPRSPFTASPMASSWRSGQRKICSASCHRSA